MNTNDGVFRVGAPKMYQIREDVTTKDQRAKLLYSWLLIGDEFMPEITIANVNYKGNMDRPGFLFGSDASAAEYDWKNIPPFEEFKKTLNDNKETAFCIASVDSIDTERVGLVDREGMMALVSYTDKINQKQERVFSRLDEVYDNLDI